MVLTFDTFPNNHLRQLSLFPFLRGLWHSLEKKENSDTRFNGPCTVFLPPQRDFSYSVHSTLFPCSTNKLTRSSFLQPLTGRWNRYAKVL